MLAALSTAPGQHQKLRITHAYKLPATQNMISMQHYSRDRGHFVFSHHHLEENSFLSLARNIPVVTQQHRVYSKDSFLPVRELTHKIDLTQLQLIDETSRDTSFK